MERIRFYIWMILALITASVANAQNDLIFMLTLDNYDYDWYTYNQRLPKSQQILKLKVTEYSQYEGEHFKSETFYHYSKDNLLTQIGRINPFSYGFDAVLNDIPTLDYISFCYSIDGNKWLTSYFSNGNFHHYLYDKSGRITKCISPYKDSPEFEAETMTIIYADNASNIIRTISFDEPEQGKSWTAEVVYNEDLSGLTIKDTEGKYLKEFKKVNNRWILVRSSTKDLVKTFNDEGLLTYAKLFDLETCYSYNQNGDLIRMIIKNPNVNNGIPEELEFEYNYNTRNNWVKQWTIKNGKRSLSAEREYIYLEQ